MNAAALAVFHIQIGFKVGGKEVLVPYRVMTLTSRYHLARPNVPRVCALLDRALR